MIKNKILVVGAGSWGTALAIQFSLMGHSVFLYGRDKSKIQEYIMHNENSRYLPNIKFPSNLKLSFNLPESIQDANIIVLSMPSSNILEFLRININLLKNKILINTCKGFSKEHLTTFSNVIKKDESLKVLFENYCVLSGPSFAKEIATNLPTAVVIAGNNNHPQELIKLFRSEKFRSYSSKDIIGVEVGGAVKNPMAVASGIMDGMGYGSNARAALISRSLVEMLRLGKALGAEEQTLTGLSGCGDLILTCTDNQSRNKRFGYYIGQGKSTTEALELVGQVVEAVHNTILIKQIGEQHGVELPIIEAVNNVINHHSNAQDEIKKLFSRAPKDEF